MRGGVQQASKVELPKVTGTQLQRVGSGQAGSRVQVELILM